ncbi:MAG: hypothetical protein J6X52_07130, partial [Clostridia bacterium]|nr:hypothetical protein [Clostridia bacterium]
YENGYFDFRGNYGEFLQKRRKAEPVKENSRDAAGKADFENAKKKKSERRTREKRFEFLTSEIARLEARLGEIDDETAENPADYVLLASLDAEQNEIRALLDGYYDEYITLEEELNSDE